LQCNSVLDGRLGWLILHCKLPEMAGFEWFCGAFRPDSPPATARQRPIGHGRSDGLHLKSALLRFPRRVIP
jgi:hypothetical protein